MPVDIGESIDNLGNTVLKNSKIRSLLINPLTFAIVLCVIIIIIMCLCNVGDEMHYIYAGLLIFGVLLVGTMLSHQAIRNKVAEDYGIKSSNEIIGLGEETSEDYDPAVPRINDLNFN